MMMKRVVLTCEECGKIALLEGTQEVLDYTIETRIKEHYNKSHPPIYPTIKYDWSNAP